MKRSAVQSRLTRQIDYMERGVSSALKAIECEEMGDVNEAANAAEECRKWLFKAAAGMSAIYKQRDTRTKHAS